MISAAVCLALVMYREARSEPIAAQIATAKILQNRATLNQKPVCMELARHRQFEWTRKYKITPPAPIGTLDRIAWRRSQQLAKSLNLLSVRGITPKHVFFNHVSLKKRYKTKNQPVKIGQLLFY